MSVESKMSNQEYRVVSSEYRVSSQELRVARCDSALGTHDSVLGTHYSQLGTLDSTFSTRHSSKYPPCFPIYYGKNYLSGSTKGAFVNDIHIVVVGVMIIPELFGYFYVDNINHGNTGNSVYK